MTISKNHIFFLEKPEKIKEINFKYWNNWKWPILLVLLILYRYCFIIDKMNGFLVKKEYVDNKKNSNLII